MTAPAVFAFAAGGLAALSLVELAGSIGGRLASATRSAGGAIETLLRAGREGRAPGAAERRRLLALGALAAFGVGAIALGPIAGAGLATGGPWLVGRFLRARREAYCRAVGAGSAAMALAVADALRGGHSLRSALGEAVRSVAGPAGRELARLSAELAAGASTEDALEALRTRVRSHRLDVLVAACLLQRRAGGDLAALLRECARSFEDESRLDDEVRTATAQARFTGWVVVALPLGGAALAELASPGWIGGLAGSFLTAWLVGIAVALQVLAALLIRRLGKVRW